MKSEILTYSNKLVDPLHLKLEDIRIEDIARALSMMCRFGGHVKEFCSVAQHSVLVSILVPEEDALWGLLHDVTEAYLVDVPRPIKRSEPFLAYRELEEKLMLVICERFNLPKEQPPSVKEIDDRVLVTEARDIANPFKIYHKDGTEVLPLSFRIESLTPKEAERLFLQRYEEIR